MRLKVKGSRGLTGSVLMVGLLSALLLGISLASYLLLVRHQNNSTVRSQAWNGALAMAEGGVEEALAQLNPSALLFTTNINRGANGWSTTAGGYVCPPRSLKDGYYDVLITADPLPVIYSTGYVRLPTFSGTLTRAVRVKTTHGALFGYAMAARSGVNFRGFGVSTDSFDSENPAKSTNGLYDPTKRQAAGDVASQSGILNIGNGKVMGKLRAGPEVSTQLGPGSSVGSISWVQARTPGVEQGYLQNDFNMDFAEVLAPYSIGLQPASETIGNTNYTYVLGSFNYKQNGEMRLRTGDKLLVTGSRTRLYVTGDFLMSGDAQVIIAPGASLELYVGGAKGIIGRVNNAGNCSDFRYYGLPSNIELSLSGNDVFLGSIYAPNATFQLGGGGNTITDFQGACVVNSIMMNGHFNFHFDENLRRKGPVRGFQVVHWEEL